MLNDAAYQFFRLTRDAREMAVLAEIEKSPDVSQRALARAAGVSATMVNAYVDDLMSRGLLYVTGETNRTYRYFLTADGAARRRDLESALRREVEVVRSAILARLGPESRDTLGAEGAEAA
ncbi:MAG TPA: winged helix-turn-helix transcriptional regulator [Planctomycetota bacterium]|nr:winged helix-turn-helix transcriptional regulator [Planctomycetota bacterium]